MPTPTGDDFSCKRYEGKLKTAIVMAFIANVMQGLNWFLGLCALTWASAVILGGLISSLTQHDYYSVVALLLLEAVRLSNTSFFAKFHTWMLVHGSTDPQQLVYDDATRQKLQGFARILEQALQVTVVGISILVPIRRLQDLNVLAAATGRPVPVDNFDGLKTSLRIFYVLVFVKGVISGTVMIFSYILVPWLLESFSLLKYYEKIVWKGMNEGLLQATDFDFFSWTFQMQAEEYRRNVMPLVVKELYGDMMMFLYYHPRHKGFQAAKVALESDNTFEREAAANIVGLWVILATESMAGNESQEETAARAANTLGLWVRFAAGSYDGSAAPSADMNRQNYKRVLARLLLQRNLLGKLAEALDNDDSGRAASSSFYELAKKVPEGVLMVRTGEKDEKVADKLMDCIHQTLELEKPNNALLYIKAMIPLVAHLIEAHGLRRKLQMSEIDDEHGNIGQYCTMAKLKMLKKDMWIIVSQNTKGLKRLQAVAAYVYALLLSEEELCRWHGDQRNRCELLRHLTETPEKRATHMLQDEKECLLLVLGRREMPHEWQGAVEEREIKEKRPLPWLTRPTTALIAIFGSVVVLVVSSIFLISRFAHF